MIAVNPLHNAAGLARVRVSTYQSVSGAGAQRMEELRSTPACEGNLAMDWDFDGKEFDEESKLRAETRKILELPELPVSATCVRDRKSTRLNSSHPSISYAVFCLKKKTPRHPGQSVALNQHEQHDQGDLTRHA